MLRLGPKFVGLAVCLAGGLACHRDAATATPTRGSAAETSPNAAVQGQRAPTAKHVSLLRAGAGHTANIDLVAASQDGTTAVSRDQIGGVRLWTALDGSAEPVVVPERGAQFLAVERREDSFTVAVVDAASGGKIFAMSADGVAALTGELPPFAPLFELHVLPGGERVVALFRDHTIKLMDRRGNVLATFGERRFRPNALLLAADGRTLLAVTKEPNANKAEVQRLRIDGKRDAPTIGRLGSPSLVESDVPLTPATLILAPDAKRVAWVSRAATTGWEIKLLELGGDVGPTAFSVVAPTHLTPTIGFASATGLLVSSNDGALSWLRDVVAGKTRPRTAAPQDFVSQGRAQSIQANTQVAGLGTWLFVHDIEARTHRYLGYRAAQTSAVALSPTGAHVAWAYTTGQIFVESIVGDAASAVELTLDPAAPAFRMLFVDEDHLVSASAAGGLQLIAWREGRVVAETGINGSMRAMQFDPRHKLLLIERHNNDARVYRVDAEAFGDPHIVADQAFRYGLLAAGMRGHEDAVMWSLDSGNKMRFYSLAALRSDLATEDIATMGTPLPNNTAAPLAIDTKGREFGLRWDGSRMELFVKDGEDTKSTAAPAGDVNQIVVSPDGGHFLAIHQRGSTASISAHDSATLATLWSFSPGAFNNDIAWSHDGKFVAMAASTGAVVLDATTGETVGRRCGLDFAVVHSPPPTAFSGQQLPSLCEG